MGAVCKLSRQDRYFTLNGKQRQCGFLTYAGGNGNPVEVEGEVRSQMDEWLAGHLNVRVAQSFQQGQGLDPIRTAARAQRWLIAIHPFASGNGRTSRLLMEYILQSVGLPTAIFDDMNEDITVSEAAWAQKLGYAMAKTVQNIRYCTDAPTRDGCQLVPFP